MRSASEIAVEHPLGDLLHVPALEQARSVSLPLHDVEGGRHAGPPQGVVQQEALLEREIRNPAVESDSEGKASLISRHQQLTGSKRMADKVAAWLKANPIEWYKYADPANPEYLDTQAMVLLARGKREEASRAILGALALAPYDDGIRADAERILGRPPR